MTWYRTGTATVVNGSTAVAGSGTAWNTQAKAGEGFLAPDGTLYEILSISSDTGIVLRVPYAGPTFMGGQYTIVPTQSYMKLLSAQVSDLLTLYQTAPSEAIEAAVAQAVAEAQGVIEAGQASLGSQVADALVVIDGKVASTAASADAAAASAATASATLVSAAKTSDLAATGGATLVGKAGDTVSNVLDWATRSRGLRAVMDALEPINRLPQKCLLKRLRTDYTEFAIYTPMTADGIYWTRWWFTNRLNVGNAGSAHMARASVALLYPTTIQAPIAQNQTTGSEAQPAVVTKITSTGVRSGTWTAAATIGGVTDVTYSTTAGDLCTYTLTGAARVGLRSYANSANGGVIAVTVREAGVEIPSGNYRVPLSGATRVVDLKAISTGMNWVPIADGLDPAKTYTVEVAVAATNPAGGRAYDGGLVGYVATAYTAVGRHGTWFTQTFSAAPTVGTYLSGGKTIYILAGATRINWKFVTSTNSGKVKFKVYDSSGAEIVAGKYVNTAADCYLAANNLVTVPVADALPAGTYYLLVESDVEKNALSTGYRVYDAGAVSYNTTTAGTVGVDDFDNQGISNGLAVEGTVTLIGTGNLELAIKVRKPTDAVGLADFVGGVHGHETNPTSFVMQADGAVVDYAGMSLGATVIANTFQWSYGTTLSFPSGGTFATTSYDAAVSPAGYATSATRTATAAGVVHEDYAFMFNVPNTAAGTEGILGGFAKAAVEGDGNYAPTLFNDSVLQFPRQCAGMVVWNRGYAAYGFPVNTAAVNQTMKGATYNPAIGSGGVDSRSILQDRSDGKFKLYNRAFTGNQASGIAAPIGYSYTSKAVYRTFKASGLDVVLA